MFSNVILGLTIAAMLGFAALAIMGTTVSAWYVVIFIIPTLVEQIASRMIATD